MTVQGELDQMPGQPDPTNSMANDSNPLRQALEELSQRWRVLIGLPLLASVAAGLISLLVPRQYEGVAIFSPAEDISSALPGNLQAIAAQFGVTAGGQGYSVYYFAQVAQSRAVLTLVAQDTLEGDGQRVPVLDLVDASGDRLEERVDDAVKELQDRMIVRTDDQSELVTIKARASSPTLAAALAGSIIEALNAVTTASIQRGGSAERRFAQGQADSARDALRAAENQLRDFYVANRNIAASPSLQVEEARLRRQIQIGQDLYLALINQAEAAKLREVKNTPAIAVVQPPQASVEKVWPKASVWAIMAAIGAFTVVVGWLYVLYPILPPSLQLRIRSRSNRGIQG